MKNKITSGFLPKTFKSGLATVSALLLFAGSSQAALTLVDTYDPASDLNDVDQSATFGSGSVAGITAANVLDLATFQTAVSTAFTNGNGGVIDFEGGSDSLTGGANEVFTTSAFGGRTLSFTDTGDAGRTLSIGGAGSNRLPISGGNALSGQYDLNFGSFSLTGGNPADRLTHFGMTILQRNQGRNFAVTATFSDLSTLTFNTISISADIDSSEDTFFGFVAPDGESITNIAVTEGSSNFTSFDDIGIIVTPVPEASTVALLGLCGIALILRRRRS